jgi:hypothetical protein
MALCTFASRIILHYVTFLLSSLHALLELMRRSIPQKQGFLRAGLGQKVAAAHSGN